MSRITHQGASGVLRASINIFWGSVVTAQLIDAIEWNTAAAPPRTQDGSDSLNAQARSIRPEDGGASRGVMRGAPFDFERAQLPSTQKAATRGSPPVTSLCGQECTHLVRARLTAAAGG